MNELLICFLFSFFISTIALVTPIFKITPVNSRIVVNQGNPAFIRHTIKNDSGFAARLKIIPPVAPQFTKYIPQTVL